MLDIYFSESIGTEKYICPYCQAKVISHKRFVSRSLAHSFHIDLTQKINGCICICPHCGKPTFFYENEQFPTSSYGEVIPKLENYKPTYNAYSDARKCMSYGAYTAAVMMCRKILMTSACDNGYPNGEGDYFIQYLDYLNSEGYIPKNTKHIVDKIKEIGNKANHRNDSITREEAEQIMDFTVILLKNLYEYKFDEGNSK
jgi:hypothetical protein